jgi:hypothetical protein
MEEEIHIKEGREIQAERWASYKGDGKGDGKAIKTSRPLPDRALLERWIVEHWAWRHPARARQERPEAGGSVPVATTTSTRRLEGGKTYGLDAGHSRIDSKSIAEEDALASVSGLEIDVREVDRTVGRRRASKVSDGAARQTGGRTRGRFFQLKTRIGEDGLGRRRRSVPVLEARRVASNVIDVDVVQSAIGRVLDALYRRPKSTKEACDQLMNVLVDLLGIK